jgi:hypothetical protein
MGNRSLLLAAALAAAFPAFAITEPGGLGAAMRASAAEEPAFMLNGNGVYIYQCRQSALNPNFYEWSFVVPDATLYDGTRSVARHATVGVYESTSDRSSVSGVVRSTQGSGAGNLPWVTIRAQPLSEQGMFAGITSIQRVNTRGGAAPGGGCGPGNEGAETAVAFQADYYFYRLRGT